MSSERELDEGIRSIKSAWRREHTARANLEKMLEQAEAERKQGAERCAKTLEVGTRWMAKAARFESENTKLRELVLGLKWCCENYGCNNLCPLYDKSEQDHCREDRLLSELGIEVDE